MNNIFKFTRKIHSYLSILSHMLQKKKLLYSYTQFSLHLFLTNSTVDLKSI